MFVDSRHSYLNLQTNNHKRQLSKRTKNKLPEFKYSQTPFVSGKLMNQLHPEYATYDGIMGVGGNVSPDMLIKMYSAGLFPWYNESEDPILWWSPNPRMVLFPKNLNVQRSMRTFFNNQTFTVTYNTCFKEVMRRCQYIPRGGIISSWINEELIAAFCELHERGLAHSVEVWQNNLLVGGLYGLALCKIFFGESMFAEVPNASKFGFISWVKLLETYDFTLIDCQVETQHLKSLGATPIPRELFVKYIAENQTHVLNYLQTKFAAI